jgi:hypothetical protein
MQRTLGHCLAKNTGRRTQADRSGGYRVDEFAPRCLLRQHGLDCFAEKQFDKDMWLRNSVFRNFSRFRFTLLNGFHGSISPSLNKPSVRVIIRAIKLGEM